VAASCRADDLYHPIVISKALAETPGLFVTPATPQGAFFERKLPMSQATDRLVDHSVLRTNQACIIALLILAFVLDAPPFVAFVAAVMLFDTALPGTSAFKRVYLALLKPRGWVKPDVQRDNPEPHRFAQGVGGSVLAIALVLFLAGLPALAWGLVWVVVALASLNLFAGICVGCLMYYALHRLGVRGFDRAPIAEA
jgi:hypothetical protein